jgi:pyroglutamyl-peptidase
MMVDPLNLKPQTSDRDTPDQPLTPDPRPPAPHSRPLLLTGFEPFGAHAVNPAGLVAKALDGWTVGRARVQGAQLPVDWSAAGPVLAGLLAERPCWVVLLGLAQRATAIRVEMQAVNIGGAIPDNAGAVPPALALIAGGPAQQVSTFPGPAIVERIAAAGLPVALSTDAGQYLCNFALYHALTWAATQAPPPPVGFIHLPPPAVLPLDDAVRAVRLALETVVQGSGIGDRGSVS